MGEASGITGAETSTASPQIYAVLSAPGFLLSSNQGAPFRPALPPAFPHSPLLSDVDVNLLSSQFIFW